MLQRVSGHQNGYIEVKNGFLGPVWGVDVLTFGVDLGCKIGYLGSSGPKTCFLGPKLTGKEGSAILVCSRESQATRMGT